jgi:hypothetical protein
VIPQLALKHHILAAKDMIVWQVTKSQNEISHLHIYRIKDLSILLCSVIKPINEPHRDNYDNQINYNHEVNKVRFREGFNLFA